MRNELTVDQIKNSVEYKWRRYQFIIYIITWLAMAVIMFGVPLLLLCISKNHDTFIDGVKIWAGVVGFMALLFAPYAVFSYSKMRYILNNYQYFNAYEVVLDKVSTSYLYRGAVYYTVSVVNSEGVLKTVNTNPYFSDLPLSKFKCGNYNNKKVVGLYDEEKEKFYIVNLVDEVPTNC